MQTIALRNNNPLRFCSFLFVFSLFDDKEIQIHANVLVAL